MKKNKELQEEKQFFLEFMANRKYKPMKLKEMLVFLEIPKKKKERAARAVEELRLEGKISRNSQGRYRLVKEHKKTEDKDSTKPILEGCFIGHSKGFGFVALDDPEQEDIFIPEAATGGAMNGDRVQFVLQEASNGRRQEGRIRNITEHAVTELVGTYQQNRNFGFVIPDNTRIPYDIYIAKEHSKGVASGEKVVVSLLSYATATRQPEGKVVEVLGDMKAPGVDILSIAKSHGIPMAFPEKVLSQAEKVKEQIIPADVSGRLDLRELQTVTIDGEDAKDLDDAISLTYTADTYELGVHIADVSNYVQYNSALDHEALKRGTSVYLVDRVIPMLPSRLSNGICSLNEGEDRLALSCIITLSKTGKILDYKLAETVIRVNKRMTYTMVNQVVTGQTDLDLTDYEPYREQLMNMQKLSRILRAKRRKRGALDFDFPESKVLLDDAGKAVDIYSYEHNTATGIIEDFMLLANETVAKEFKQKKLPFVYRTHEEPDAQKVEQLLHFLHNQGIEAVKAKEKIQPKEIQKILRDVAGKPNEALISRLALRTMKQARYTSDSSRHFGLAAVYYCHFTSPIRRYPDLQIHRIIKDSLRGRLTKEKIESYRLLLDAVAQQSSAMERRAEETERETIKLKKAEYMSQHIGETFEGVISGITGWGLYVELPNTVEGLVHVNTLRDDFYNFDDEKYEMVGEVTKKTFTLGQKLRVRVADTDLTQKTIDFILVEESGNE
ncbi:MAG: ribonuclease R [Lachnospiraceae bacterium]